MIKNYIWKDNKQLRCGYTTGSCAAAASKAATRMLFLKEAVDQIELMTPKGILLKLRVEDIQMGENQVSCAIRKDAGDDPDVTDGILIYATVSFSDTIGIHLDAGQGVGRVTKKGLEQDVGSAAINVVPRKMIHDGVMEEIETFVDKDEKIGIKVIISVPEGEEKAKRTFNPRLGIIGGISILGTSGIVVPMSEEALIASIRTEMKMHVANDEKYLVISLGNYGEAFSTMQYNIGSDQIIKCSNFVGETVDMAVELGFKGILFISHIGKFVKVAAGIMNTHSKNADARMEILASHAALNGASIETVKAILNCITTDEALDVLDEQGIETQELEKPKLKTLVVESLLDKISYYIKKRTYDKLEIGVVLFTNKHGFLGQTTNVNQLLAKVMDQIEQINKID